MRQPEAQRTDAPARLEGPTFRALAALAQAEWGLTLVPEKAPVVQARLRGRLGQLGLADFGAYCALLESAAGRRERRHLISALTTNVSHFFREPHHFEMIAALARERRAGAPLRLWSAGCANGQEPLSAAMAVLEAGAPEGSRLLGTDIDPRVIAFARAGLYPERLLSGLSAARRGRHFRRRSGPEGPAWQALPRLRRCLTFQEGNLLGAWPPFGPFDVILCRNTVIYFEAATQARLWPRFRAALRPGGLLMLGHSERIPDPAALGLAPAGPTSYRRVAP